MPRLEEVQFYLHGLWMLIKGQSDGFKWLDFSQRGFWRSWWALAYCLPPMALNWAGVRLAYLAAMPEGTRAGAGYIGKLAVLDAMNWIVCAVVLALVMLAAGFSARIAPLITAVNWLAVPVQWAMTPVSLIQLVTPENPDLYLTALLPFLLLSLAAHFLVMRRFADNKVLPTAAFLLAMIVASLWTSITLADLLDIQVS
jgi:hypothetical protein